MSRTMQELGEREGLWENQRGGVKKKMKKKKSSSVTERISTPTKNMYEKKKKPL